MVSLRANPSLFKSLGSKLERSAIPCVPATLRCSAAPLPRPRSYIITLLPGDDIGLEVISVAKDILSLAGAHDGIDFSFLEMSMGGAAIDAAGVSLLEETLSAAKELDA